MIKSGRFTTVYNVEVDVDHTYFVGSPDWGWSVWAHNAGCKQGGKLIEPTLPPKHIVETKGVRIEHYYASNDHAPPHAHVSGKGPKTKIGMNGKPLKGEPELSADQASVVEEHLSTIRTAINKIHYCPVSELSQILKFWWRPIL